MQERLKLFGRIALFWMLFFVLARVTFLLFHFDQTSDLTWKEIGTVLLLGLRMDAAMTGYWLILTGLLFTFSPFFSNRSIAVIHNFIIIALLTISITIVVVDLELYKHWGFRMNTTPLFYAGEEAVGSVNLTSLIFLILIFIVQISLFLFWYFRKLAHYFHSLKPMSKKWIIPFFLITGLLFIPIRSSFDVAPLNTGVVYFHKTKAFPNHAGINVVWNFFRSLSSDNDIRYPDHFYTSENLQQEFGKLYEPIGQTKKIITASQPNIILIILEGFTSKIIEPLGGKPGITPQFTQLAKEGILFTNLYASGDRTDKGLISILSAYPAQPRTSIIKYPEKTQHLSFLPKAMNDLGYHTSFVYGGDIGFANMEAYLTTTGLSHMTEDDDFDGTLDNSKWGVADHFVFNRMLQECDTARNPFFKVMLSLSSHEPFEVPMEPVFDGNDEATLFLNACYYTDKSLGNFIKEAKTKSWWKNTLIIITADHGHRFPNPEELKEKERFKIPMLWLGGVLTKSDTTITPIGSQTDIANTLLGQISVPQNNFAFSRNILADSQDPFAVYIFNNGFGFVSKQGECIYDFDLNDYLKKEGSEEEWKNGKIYMQSLFNDYNKR